MGAGKEAWIDAEDRLIDMILDNPEDYGYVELDGNGIYYKEDSIETGGFDVNALIERLREQDNWGDLVNDECCSE